MQIFRNSKWNRLRVGRTVGSLTLLSLCLMGFQNCGLQASHSPGSLSDLSSIGSSQMFASAKSVLNRNCVGCHRQGGSAAFSPLDLENTEAFVSAGYIVPGDPSQSKLLYRLKNYPVGTSTTRNMPLNATLSAADFNTLNAWVLRSSSVAGPFLCNENDGADVTSMPKDARRLTRRQYLNTLHAILSRFLTLAETNTILSAALTTANLPLDGGGKYKRWDNNIDSVHTNAYFNVADKIASQVSTNYTYYSRLLKGAVAANPGACPTVSPDHMTLACKQQFVRNFGLRVLRRPLSETDELPSLIEEFTGKTEREGVANVVFRLLLSPSFLFHLEDHEIPVEGNAKLYKLSSYSIINRLSYSFWNAPPDDQLLAWAAAEDLSADAKFLMALSHVLSEAGKVEDSMAEFFNDWLKLDELQPFFNNSPAFSLMANGVTYDNALHAAMVNEVTELGSYIVRTGGRLTDLFTTDVSFARHSGLMKIYGMSQAAAPAPLTTAIASRLPAGTRSGLLTRAALVVAPSGAQNPVLRGVRIRKEILCLDIDPPPADNMDALQPPPYNAELTVRERYTQKTSPAACISCHRMINPIGFALSNFNGLGWFQTQEMAFDADGSFANKHLPVDAAVDLSEVVGPGARAENPEQFSAMISARPETKTCLTTEFSKFFLQRDARPESEGCRLNRMYSALQDGTMLDFVKSLAMDREFRLRRIEDGTP